MKKVNLKRRNMQICTLGETMVCDRDYKWHCMLEDHIPLLPMPSPSP